MAAKIEDSVREEIINLVNEGLHYRDIAEQLGVSVGVIHKIVSSDRKALIANTSAQFEKVNQHLDDVIRFCWAKFYKSQDHKVFNIVLDAIRQKRAMFGLDAPKKMSVTHLQGQIVNVLIPILNAQYLELGADMGQVQKFAHQIELAMNEQLALPEVVEIEPEAVE